MRLDDEAESRNVEDRRGGFGGGGRGATIGIGTLVVALAASYFLGIDPRVVLQGAAVLQGQHAGQAPAPAANPSPRAGADDPRAMFTRKVLGNIERTWSQVFPAQLHRQYSPPTLVMFEHRTSTACGTGQTAMGPFYCPADRKVYIDLGFYDELRQKFGAGGDFAQAYVIAHEVGHHVQKLLGISDQVDAARGRVSEAQANRLSVRLELQADCFAGVWAYNARQANQRLIEPGEFEQGLRTAAAIGDDTLQRRSQGYVVPDAFTHGTSEQRVSWLRRGMQHGDVRDCDTFAAR
ncbi:KPN_02809 family neutral zinc metallopeptidase [Burkholderia perseverans]|uniref:KPN_02809 family neutral zinc metallopeptidase n=1 Tax=Burkholderia perseverans TaxID=2615214 RepID=UPI001FF0285E|nr:neutral zinc metallopeptidase [Burkholderia perseverans]